MGDREINVEVITFSLLLFSENRQKAVKGYLAFMQEEGNEDVKEWEEINANEKREEKKTKKKDSKELIKIIENERQVKITDSKKKIVKRGHSSKAEYCRVYA